MNKTEPVRARHELRDFESFALPKFDTAELTNSDSDRTPRAAGCVVGNFRTSVVTKSRTSKLWKSATSELAPARATSLATAVFS
jgi:hypothetical protein